MGFKNGEDHGQPVRIPSIDRPSRRSQGGRSHESLNLHQHWPRAFNPRENGGAGRPEISFGEEQLRRICNFTQSAACHLEHTDLIGRTKPIFHRAQDPKLVGAFPFEGKHRVHHMLDHPRPGDLTVFRDMAD